MYYLKQKHSLSVFAFFIFIATSCSTSFVPVKAEHDGYRISDSLSRDTFMYSLMAPYRDSVDRSMNQVIGVAEKSLEKKQPEGTLGNFMADAMFYAGSKKYGIPVDGAFVNYGGVRITQLAAGPVTRSKVFEMMPFDNLVIIQRLKGSELQAFLNLIADRGGWPMSGITMQIKDRKAINVQVGGKPLDLTKTYTIINSDYVASGGDNAAMLKNLPQESNGYLMRDAIFDYIKMLQAEGKKINANIENRVTNVE
jgi:2',3'-cyclic-nucleotide 2'-phosphodiesterase (5'-nucleotidase family)